MTSRNSAITPLLGMCFALCLPLLFGGQICYVFHSFKMSMCQNGIAAYTEGFLLFPELKGAGKALHNTEPKAWGFETLSKRKAVLFRPILYTALSYFYIFMDSILRTTKQIAKKQVQRKDNLQIMMSGQIQGQMIHRNQKHVPLLQIKKSHIGISLMLSNCFSFYISSIKDLQSFF